MMTEKLLSMGGVAVCADANPALKQDLFQKPYRLPELLQGFTGLCIMVGENYFCFLIFIYNHCIFCVPGHENRGNMSTEFTNPKIVTFKEDK
jgi:hypothetical protein